MVKKTTSQERQLKWIIGIMVIVFIVAFLFFWISAESKVFDCGGFNWQKEKFGDIPLYTTMITGYGANSLPINFKLNLRNDPRKLDIPVEGDVKFIKGRPVYLSLDMESEVDNCGSIALISFGQFMSGMGFDLRTAITTKNLSAEYKRPHVTCDNKLDNTVLILTLGNETKITQQEDNENCYVLSLKDCEIIEVVEKFEVATLSTFTGRQCGE